MVNASKHFDPQLGVDVHTYAIPPAPLPTPHISMVLDFWDYLPIIGATTNVHGLKRSVAGTEGKVIHIPLGTWAPPLKVPMGPQTDDELFMGSKTVRVDGDPFSRRFMPTLSCNIVGMPSPFRPRQAARPPAKSLNLPLTANIALPHDVYVGGPPTISIMAMLMKVGLGALKRVGKSKRFQDLMGKFKEYRVNKFKGMDSGFLKCKILRAEPVDIRTGSVRVEQLDFSLPGRLPLIWGRYYSSNNIDQQGLCGYGWRTPADAMLTYYQDKDYWQIELPEGPLYFSETPELAGREHSVYGLPIGRLWFEQEDKKRYWLIETDKKIIYRFKDNGKNNLPNAQLAIAAIEDRNGNQWAFEYQKGQLTRLIEKTTDGATGREIHIIGEDNRIWQMRLFYSAEHSYRDLTGYGYNKDNQLIAQLDNLGKARQYNYQDNYMTYHQDRLGQKFYYDYNQDNKVTHAWGDGGLYDYQFNWLDEYHELEMTDSLGYTSIIRFSEDNLPLCEIDPEGGATFFGYDEFGRTLEVTSPSGKKTRWEYDNQGNICKEILADDSTIEINYQDNLPVKVIDQAGQVWQQDFDNKGNLIKVTDPTEVFTEYQYDILGQLTQIKQPNGASHLFAYSPLGFIKERIDSANQKTSYQHDIKGNLLQEINALNQTTSYRYDLKDRLITVINTEKKQITIHYDAEDQPIEYIDEAGSSTKLTYNPTGEVTGCQTPDGQWVNYQYDTEDQLIAVQNQLKQKWQLKRDGLGRIIEEIDYWGQSTHYHYDNDDNVIAKTDPLGNILNYHYDALGRLTEKYHKTTLLTQYHYDARGLMIKCDNPWRKLAWEYDAAGNLLVEDQDNFKIQHHYNARGQYIGKKNSAGNEIILDYNKYGQLSIIKLGENNNIYLHYDELGRLQNEQLSSTLKREFNYNIAGQLTSQKLFAGANAIFNTDYYYNHQGKLVERKDNLCGNDLYCYDLAGKLVSHIDPLGKVKNFIFDFAGNLIKEKINQNSLSNIWERHGEMNSIHYIYDKAGQLTKRYSYKSSDDKEYFEWNESQQLIAVHNHQDDVYYGYDGLGRRIFKKTKDRILYFFWEGDVLSAEINKKFIENFDASIVDPISISSFDFREKKYKNLSTLWSKLREYIYYPGSFWPLALLERNNQQLIDIYYYYCDINGNPMRLTNNMGNIVWSQKSGVWGEKEVIDISLIDNPIRFLGHYYDDETNFHYNRHRYYDPYLNRYISLDPIGLWGGENPYLFVPDPWIWSDPLGLNKTCGIDEPYILFNKTHSGSLPKPKGKGPNGGRLQSHHGLQQEWAIQNLSKHGYDPKKAPTITLETGKGLPHTKVSNAQNARRDARVATGNGKWSSSLQDELSNIKSDLRNAGFDNETIDKVLEQQYSMLDKLNVPYTRI